MFHTEEARERYESRVDRSGGPSACHPWTRGVTAQGYGMVSLGGKKEDRELAHRIAYRLAHGEIPDGHHVDHSCHNGTKCKGGKTCPHRRCCNPLHLVAKLPDHNRADSHRANERKERCPAGHPYTQANTMIQVKWTSAGKETRSRKCRECGREYDRSPKRVQAQRDRRERVRNGG